jgi:putative SOS response-associated peptidase YedK
MCGRHTHLLTWSKIVNLYRLTLPDEEPEQLKPNYNVAPTNVMPIIRPAGNGRELVMAGWGLVPFWLKPEQLSQQPYSTINARSDRIRTAPTYREPFKTRPAWCRRRAGTNGRRSTPRRSDPITSSRRPSPSLSPASMTSGKATAAAPSPALQSSRQAPRRARRSITTACLSCSKDSQFDEWMRGTPDQAAVLMKPYACAIEAWEVGPEVGNVKNNKSELMERIGLL